MTTFMPFIAEIFSTGKVEMILEQRGYVLITQQNLRKFEFFYHAPSQILLGDKNETYLCSKIVSTLVLPDTD